MNNETELNEVEEVKVDLTVQDLSILANIINLAAKRGAFSADDATAVGSAYDKLVAFIKAVVKQTSEETEVKE